MEQENAVSPQFQHLMERARNTFWEYLGCEIVEAAADKVVVRLVAQQHHLNLIGIVHGGVTSSMLDNAMGVVLMLARPDDKIVTTNLNVQFVAPMQPGELYVTAEIVHQSRKMLTAIGRVTDAEGRLGTLGTGTFRVI
ncbi:PaaI family thioesterase [Paenibacillus chitinolyticus]|uniref:PaaI family thioesterase n=1 Tax=Paenibacillus TaxID=44249 RepID=UPI001C2F2F9F|nr:MULTISPECIES: PaaI family thioesterase [Paenibacillus]GKS09912.1 phenylacetic acid degradation protein PaaD [Paenibacillus chitinolyticus]